MTRSLRRRSARPSRRAGVDGGRGRHGASVFSENPRWKIFPARFARRKKSKSEPSFLDLLANLFFFIPRFLIFLEISGNFQKIFEISEISGKMTHSKNKIGWKLQKRVVFWGFSEVFSSARRAFGKVTNWVRKKKNTVDYDLAIDPVELEQWAEDSVFYLLLPVCITFRGALRAPKSDLRSTYFSEIPLRFWSFQTFLFFRWIIFPFFSQKTQNFSK